MRSPGCYICVLQSWEDYLRVFEDDDEARHGLLFVEGLGEFGLDPLEGLFTVEHLLLVGRVVEQVVIVALLLLLLLLVLLLRVTLLLMLLLLHSYLFNMYVI